MVLKVCTGLEYIQEDTLTTFIGLEYFDPAGGALLG